MFAAPPEQSLEWSDQAVDGAHRFLRRLWRSVVVHCAQGQPSEPDMSQLSEELKALRRQIHQTLDKVTDDLGRRHTFNTAIAAVMELMNALAKVNASTPQARAVRQEALEIIVLMLAPITPHICHHLWHQLGHEEAIVHVAWPEVDRLALVQDSITLMVQVNGKLRSKITVAADVSKQQLESLALADEHAAKFTENKQIRKVIVVPGKLVNIVVG